MGGGRPPQGRWVCESYGVCVLCCDFKNRKKILSSVLGGVTVYCIQAVKFRFKW